MALDKFELKNEHIALIKNLVWDENIIGLFEKDEELPLNQYKSPFGGDNIIEDMGLILYGKPEGEFDPLSDESETYTKEQIEDMKNLLKNLKIALDITIFCGNFEVGWYSKKHHLRNWKKNGPKDL